MTHNGWKNYETWCVNLWLTNDGGEYWVEAAQEALDRSSGDTLEEKKDDAASSLAKRLKEEIEEGAPTLDDIGGIYSDLLNAALEEVDWYEIAEAFMEGLEPEEEEV